MDSVAPEQQDKALVGTIIPSNRWEWTDEVLSDKSRFEQCFEDLGLDDSFTQEAVQEYKEAKEIFRTPLPKPPNFYGTEAYGEWVNWEYERRRDSVWDKVNAFLGRQQFLVEDTTTIQVDVPLFVLGSPGVERSKVTYSEEMSAAAEATWDITIFGTGMGESAAFKVKHSATFTSSSGDTKLIFVPVVLVVELVAVIKKGKLLSRGLRSQMEPLTGAKSFTKGITLLSPDVAAKYGPRPGASSDRFPLRGERETEIASYTHGWEGSGKLEPSVGFEAFNLKASAKVSVIQERKVTLSFELPGGHDYELKPLAESHGIWWQTN